MYRLACDGLATLLVHSAAERPTSSTRRQRRGPSETTHHSGAPTAERKLGMKEHPLSPVLELEKVTKAYKSRGGATQIVLESVDLSIRDGEFLSVVGPSGCGKTTLLRICAGLEEQSEGRVSYRGSPGAPKPGQYGIVFQHPALLAWRTVMDNVLMAGRLLGLPRARAEESAGQLLDLVGLGVAREKYPKELSGGMQQRVAIARALLPDPALLLMDEPFGALDALTREQLNLALQELHCSEKKSILFVTHNIEEAVFLSDRVAVLKAPGRLIDMIGVPLSRPRSLETLATADAQECAQRVRRSLFGENSENKR